MKSKMVSIAIALMGIVINSYAQTKLLSEPPRYKPLKETKSLSGTITGWTSNDDYFYDGLFLQVESEKYLVKFSPHLGSQLTAAITVGDTISLSGVEIPESIDKNAMQLVNVTTHAEFICDDISTVIPSCTHPIYGGSTIVQLQKNELGQTKGIVLSDKTILRLSLDAAEQLSNLTVVGTFVSYSGNQILRHGEYSAHYYTIVQCKTITINEKQYLIE